jgi:hypothetical protein
MRYHHLLRLAVGTLITAILFSHGAAALAVNKHWAEGRILVKPRAQVSAQQFTDALDQHGIHSVGKIRALEIHLVQVPPQAEQAVAVALSHNPNIEFAEVDELNEPVETTANDPYFGNAWHLNTMNAPAAWDQSKGDGIVVAVLDSGVDPNHPDLQGQLVPGWNLYDGNNDTSDVYGHGTKVAGVIAAASNNGIGVTSLAWNTRIMPVRVSQTNGSAYTSTIASGLTWAADHGARVANISYSISGQATVISAAQYLRGKGGLVCSSAGNDGSNLATAPTDAIMTVSATDSGDNLASWSSYGDVIDVAAPGAGIWTTVNGGGYGQVSGTSFSSPATAAVAALVMSRNPSLSPAQVENIIESSSLDLGTPGKDVYFGYGRVDAGAAVLAAGGQTGTTPAPDTEPPTVSITSPTGGAVSGTVQIAANAGDNTGVASVAFYIDGNRIASDTTSPYSLDWNSNNHPNGTAQLVARAYDSAGNEGISQTVSVMVDNQAPVTDTVPPTLSILSPSANASVSGTVQISVSASDNVALALLQCYVDNKLIGTTNASSLSCSWNTRKVAQGVHTISARAEDTSANVSTTAIQVNVGAGGSTGASKPRRK